MFAKVTGWHRTGDPKGDAAKYLNGSRMTALDSTLKRIHGIHTKGKILNAFAKNQTESYAEPKPQAFLSWT